MKVKSADRTILILEAIAGNNEGLTHGDLALSLHIPKSSLSSLLSTLTEYDYIVFDTVSKRYLLGPQFLKMAGVYLDRIDLVHLGKPIVREITQSVDESAEIAIRSGTDILIVCKEDCTRALKMVIQLGDRAPLYATAAGKAILAHLNDYEKQDYLQSVKIKRITSKTLTDVDALDQELKMIQSGSIAYSREEYNEGIIAMAVPIFTIGKRVAGSIVVPVPTVRFSPQKESDIERVLKIGAAELSGRLGYDRAA